MEFIKYKDCCDSLSLYTFISVYTYLYTHSDIFISVYTYLYTHSDIFISVYTYLYTHSDNSVGAPSYVFTVSINITKFLMYTVHNCKLFNFMNLYFLINQER